MPLIDQIFNRRSKSSNKSNRQQQNDTDEQTSNLVDEKSPSPVAVIYRSELDYLSRCVLDYPNIETGGQLFGFWTNQGVPVVLYAIGPGRNANHQPTFFNQDGEYLSLVGNALLHRYGLCHIGEWHSHHQLGLAQPSGHDARTMHNGLARIPQRRLLLCICNFEHGCSTVNPYNFHENDMYGYADAVWQVIEMDSPYRKLVDRELSDMLIHPLTAKPRHGANRTLQIPEPVTQAPRIKIPSTYWVSRGENMETLRQMRALTQSVVNSDDVATQANEEGVVQLYMADRDIALRFPTDFPQVAPELYVRGQQMTPGAEWRIPDDDNGIADSFHQWLTELFADQQ